MYVSVAVCLHLNESICSTCTYEWVWKPYSDVNVSCACASYSLIICNLCVMGREYLLFVFRLLWVFVYHISPDYFVLLLLFLGFPFYIVMYCLPVLFLLAVYMLNYLSVLIKKCFVNAVLYKCNKLCCYFEFLLIYFIVIWLIEWKSY